MKSKFLAGGAAAASLLVFNPASTLAQRGGFQIGIAQPPVGPPPPVPLQRSPGTFGVTQVPPIVAPFPFGPVGPAFPLAPPFQLGPPLPSVPLVPNFPTVIVPNHILVPGQTAFPPVPNVSGFPPGVFPVTPVSPAFPLPPGRPGAPYPGMPRADVIRLLGQPSITIITSSGETLHFQGGVTVIIQNGQVAGPK